MKKPLNIAGFILSLVFGLYLLIAFYFGGFGKQSVIDLAQGDSMLLFAHRGILIYYPEHSHEGAEAAKQLGFNGIEIDIRKTADDELIVFHDATAERMLGINKPVESLTLNEIKSQSMLFHGNRTSNYVFTVDEFLSAYSKNFIIYCDMKITSFKDVGKLVNIINNHSAVNTCIMASADFFILEYLRIKHSEMITALEGFDAGKEWSYYFIPKKLRPEYYSGFFQNVNAEHVDWLKEKGLLNSRIVYGIEKSNFEAAKRFGIKNIIMDYDSSFGNISNVLK
jgi:glycerophosphoryl diester phosphodiesterase